MPPRDVPRTRTIEIVCHQGANEYAPANTFAAAQICIDWGMDYVEIDVNTSRDGVLYLFHGPDLHFTTNATGLFHELMATEIDSLDVGSWFDPRFSGERVPRLDEFLRWIKGKAKVFFDVKRTDLPQLIALVEDVGLQDESFFWFGDHDQALRFRHLAPHLVLKVNADDAAGAHMAYEQFGANIIETSLAALNQGLVDACQERNLRLMVFHKDKEPGAFRRILDWGVKMINCDHGDVVARVAAEHGAVVRSPDSFIRQPDHAMLNHRLAAIFLDCGDTLVDEGTEVKPDGNTSIRADLIPGADDLVRELKHRGYLLALVADGPVATFQNNLSPYGLYELFDAQAISETVGVSKPDAAMFLCALEQLGIQRKDYPRVLMVGNHLGRDIKGANALGLTSVWLDWAPRRAKTPADASEQPDFTIKTPLELLDLVDRIENGAPLQKEVEMHRRD
ncbi:MAG: glycerophosphodiester phosphodiesterase family protein [Caldilinea sp.]